MKSYMIVCEVLRKSKRIAVEERMRMKGNLGIGKRRIRDTWRKMSRM